MFYLFAPINLRYSIYFQMLRSNNPKSVTESRVIDTEMQMSRYRYFKSTPNVHPHLLILARGQWVHHLYKIILFTKISQFLNQYQACLYLFQCIFHGESEYRHQIEHFVTSFFFVVCSRLPRIIKSPLQAVTLENILLYFTANIYIYVNILRALRKSSTLDESSLQNDRMTSIRRQVARMLIVNGILYFLLYAPVSIVLQPINTLPSF